MKLNSTIIIIFLSFGLGIAQPMKALIIDGQNNHVMWPKTTMMMKQYLEATGLYKVDIQRTHYTWKGDEYLLKYPLEGKVAVMLENPQPDPDFKPKFKKYDVVISNFGWRAADWPTSTQKKLEKYLKKGGGLVIVHAADNSFPKWLEYNKMIGLGGWGDRNEKDGPYVYYNDQNELIRDDSPGKGGSHGPQREYVVDVRDESHPITKGMPSSWLHAKDELYDRLRGPAENMTVLATAYAGVEDKGSGRHEPVLMAINYGEGRIFHTILGHADYSMECVGFIVSLQRGTEWAATGEVTQTAIPEDFPSDNKTSSRSFKP